MIHQHRKIHRLIWLVMTPLLLTLVLIFSNPNNDLTPENGVLPEVTGRGDKGAVPERY